MTTELRKTIETLLLPRVQKPMRYAGGELNCICKDLASVTLHGVLCFPDLYDIGMSHTGLQILYHVINREKRWALSRCFHPWGDAEAIMRQQGIPLYTLEYFTPVREADWVGFSVQYELQYSNIVNMLDLAGIAPMSADRTERDPVVIAGGPCVGNPEPLASFIDLFVIGDGEEALLQINRLLEQFKTHGAGRAEFLREAEKITGVYAPALHDVIRMGSFLIPQPCGASPVRAAKLPVLDEAYYPCKPVVPLIEVVHRRLAVEVMRGCTRGCRFCSAGMYYRPVRERTVEAVCNQIRQSIASTGWNEVGLLSLSTADYSSLSPLLQSLRSLQQWGRFSCALPSTRLDALTPEQLDMLDKVSPVNSFTIAPEAGSERLRRVINKDFTDEMIYTAVADLMRRNVNTLKLYFLLGLPTEGWEDIEAIVAMITRISGMVRAVSARRSVNVSLSPFSPKPHTPFERAAVEARHVLLEKGAYVKQSLRRCRNVKVTCRDPGQTLLETLLARGDRSLGALIYRAWREGARFDGWDERFNLQRWLDCATSLSIDIKPFLDAVSSVQPLPWSAVSTGVSADFLAKEYRKAYRAETTGDCRDGGCSGCGICTPYLQPVFQLNARPAPAADSGSTARRVAGEKNSRRWRFHYRKTGLMRFLGHLDMVAAIHRACRMAHLPLVYSCGYNPHPRIAFGPPLPFGVEGMHEAFDALLAGDPLCDPLTMNKWLPEGLRITGCNPVPEAMPSLDEIVTAAKYRIQFIESIDNRQIYSHIKEVLAKESIYVLIEKNGVKKEKNIRPGIFELFFEEKVNALQAVLSMKHPHSCKPLELINALFEEGPIPDFFISRTRLFNNCFSEI